MPFIAKGIFYCGILLAVFLFSYNDRIRKPSILLSFALAFLAALGAGHYFFKLMELKHAFEWAEAAAVGAGLAFIAVMIKIKEASEEKKGSLYAGALNGAIVAAPGADMGPLDGKTVSKMAARILSRLGRRRTRASEAEQRMADAVWEKISKEQNSGDLYIDERNVKLLTLKLLRKMRKNSKAAASAESR